MLKRCVQCITIPAQVCTMLYTKVETTHQGLSTQLAFVTQEVHRQTHQACCQRLLPDLQGMGEHLKAFSILS